MSVTFNYNGSVTADIKTHLKLLKLFGRQPTAPEFMAIFRLDPMVTVHIKPWIKELILDDCLDGLEYLEAPQVKTIISLMIKNHATAVGIHKFIDDVVTIEGVSTWSKKAKTYFTKVEAEDELIDAIATFHEDGVVADGLKLQSEYDDYIHRVYQKRDAVSTADLQSPAEPSQTVTE